MNLSEMSKSSTSPSVIPYYSRVWCLNVLYESHGAVPENVSISEPWKRLAIPCPCVRRLHVMTSVAGGVTYVLARCVPLVPLARHHISDADTLGKSLAWIANMLPGFPHQSEVCCQMMERLWKCRRVVSPCQCCGAHRLPFTSHLPIL